MKYQQILCILAGLLPLAVILVLSAASSDFVLFRNFISDLGVSEHAMVFNATLVVAAFLAVPFAFHVYKGSYLIVLFLATILSLIGVGLFPSTSELHKPLAALFFVLAFVTVLAAGTKMTRRKSRWISFALGVLGFAGLAVFSPFTETLLVFAIGLWVAGVGLFSKRLYEKS